MPKTHKQAILDSKTVRVISSMSEYDSRGAVGFVSRVHYVGGGVRFDVTLEIGPPGAPIVLRDLKEDEIVVLN